jgi:hypothetical protein
MSTPIQFDINSLGSMWTNRIGGQEVRVVNMCEFLDALYGSFEAWMHLDFEESSRVFREWMAAHPDVCYHAWEGPSYLSGAELDKGLEKTIAAGKSVLLLESLS